MKLLDNLLFLACWGFLAASGLALAALHLAGDRWWPGTLLLFGPRWALALPLVLLVPLALARAPRLLLPLALGAAVVFVPFMGLRWAFPAPQAVAGIVVRVLTCNVRTGQFDSRALSEVIRSRNVDLVALQECPPDVRLELPPGWRREQAGVVAVFSRHPVKALPPVLVKHPPHVWERHSLLPCVVTLPQGEIVFNSVYLPSPRYGLQHLLDRSTGIDPAKAGLLTSETANRASAARTVRKALGAGGLPFVAAGDFNTPVESAIYRETWADLQNAFSEAGRGYGWTFRDAVRFVPIDTRVDHVLAGNGAVPLGCEVGPDVGSDHRPVIADILVAGGS